MGLILGGLISGLGAGAGAAAPSDLPRLGICRLPQPVASTAANSAASEAARDVTRESERFMVGSVGLNNGMTDRRRCADTRAVLGPAAARQV